MIRRLLAACVMAAGLVALAACQDSSPWPPETTTALYQVAYASAKRHADNPQLGPRYAFRDAREPLEMLETLLYAATVESGAGARKAACALSEYDRLRLAEIAVAYSVAALVDNRYDAYRVPTILDLARTEMQCTTANNDGLCTNCDEMTPRQKRVMSEINRLISLTDEHVRHDELIAIPVDDANYDNVTSTISAVAGEIESFYKGQKNLDNVDDLRKAGALLKNHIAVGNGGGKGVAYLPVAFLTDFVSLKISDALEPLATPLGRQVAQFVCGKAADARAIANPSSDVAYDELCPGYMANGKNAYFSCTAPGPGADAGNDTPFSIMFCGGTKEESGKAERIAKLFATDLPRLRDWQHRLYAVVNELRPVVRSLDAYEMPACVTAAVDRRRDDDCDSRPPSPQDATQGQAIPAQKLEWDQLRSLFAKAYKRLPEDALATMWPMLRASDFDDLSRMFRAELSRRQRVLMDLVEKAKEKKNDDAAWRLVDQHLDDLPYYRSFQTDIDAVRATMDKYKVNRAEGGSYTSAILVAATDGTVDGICRLARTLDRRYGIKADIVYTIGVTRTGCDGAPVAPSNNDAIKDLISQKTTRQLLFIWGGHGENGTLYLDNTRNLKFKYDEIHKALLSNTSVSRTLLLIEACQSGSAAKSQDRETPSTIIGITAEGEGHQLVYAGLEVGLLVNVDKALNAFAEEGVQFDHLDLYRSLLDQYRRGLPYPDISAGAKGQGSHVDLFVGAAPALYTLRGQGGTFPTQRFLLRPVRFMEE